MTVTWGWVSFISPGGVAAPRICLVMVIWWPCEARSHSKAKSGAAVKWLSATADGQNSDQIHHAAAARGRDQDTRRELSLTQQRRRRRVLDGVVAVGITVSALITYVKRKKRNKTFFSTIVKKSKYFSRTVFYQFLSGLALTV